MADLDLTPFLERLENRFNERMDCVEEKLDKVRNEDIPNIRVDVAREISALKVKAGMWALVTGAVGSLAGVIIYLIAR